MRLAKVQKNFNHVYHRSLKPEGQDLVRRYTLYLLNEGRDRRIAHLEALDMVLTQHQDVLKRGGI